MRLFRHLFHLTLTSPTNKAFEILVLKAYLHGAAFEALHEIDVSPRKSRGTDTLTTLILFHYLALYSRSVGDVDFEKVYLTRGVRLGVSFQNDDVVSHMPMIHASSFSDPASKSRSDNLYDYVCSLPASRGGIPAGNLRHFYTTEVNRVLASAKKNELGSMMKEAGLGLGSGANKQALVDRLGAGNGGHAGEPSERAKRARLIYLACLVPLPSTRPYAAPTRSERASEVRGMAGSERSASEARETTSGLRVARCSERSARSPLSEPARCAS